LGAGVLTAITIALVKYVSIIEVSKLTRSSRRPALAVAYFA
jgi:hypothetical protein